MTSEQLDELINAITSDPQSFEQVEQIAAHSQLQRTFNYLMESLLRRATPPLILAIREFLKSLPYLRELNANDIINAYRERKEKK